MRFNSLMVCISLLAMISILTGQNMVPGPQPIAVDISDIESQIINTNDRDPATYTVSINPTTLMISYFDYMIGGYNSLPLCVNPNQYGGYFATFHGKATSTGTRRVYYSYISDTGIINNLGTLSTSQIIEGYSSIAIDPVSGCPLYAWHSNVDGDAQLEVNFAYDSFLFGQAGFLSTPTIIVNNPSTLPAPYNTTDNEYIWPTVKIGPSPVNGMRRVYVLTRNAITHITGTTNASENVRISYADFNQSMLEMGAQLTWNYTSIPTLDAWNHANDGTYRRLNYAFTVGNDGRIYVIGYHSASYVPSETLGDIIEPDLDAFVCDNYGQGTWTRIIVSSHYPSWNPPTNFGTGPGYYKFNDGTTPIPSSSLSWKFINSSHINAVMDDTNGDIHIAGIWAQGFTETVGGVLKAYYHPTIQVMRDLVYDTDLQTFSIREIYPIAGTSTDNVLYLPWDQDGNGTVDAYDITYGDPISASNWPFPYWDSSASGGAMMFHYSNTKITTPNAQGMMAAVWQDSNRGRLYNLYPASYPEFAAFATAPEIWISVSPDFGVTWSDPIKLNKVETPQLAGMKPMWVYPADQIKYTGLSPEGKKIGKLALMFYDDTTWGSYQQVPPVGANDGGNVKFMELNITFPLSSNLQDPFGAPIVLTSSMALMAGVQIDGIAASNGDVLAAYVNVNNEPQLRGKGTIQVTNNIAGCLLQVYTETNGESVYYKLWDASTNAVLNLNETTPTVVNGTIGSWPNDIYWLHYSTSITQNISLQSGWNMISLNVHPSNMDISTIFSAISANLSMVKSTDGVYIPNNPFNTLTQLQDCKGYYVKVTASCTLTVEGSAIDLAAPINLASGWNLTAYTPQASQAVVTALNSIAENLVQVKGLEGIYIPNNPFNTLTSMSPGKCYWINLSTADQLTYPLPAKNNTIAENSQIASPWGNPNIKTDSEVIMAKIIGNAKENDVLAAFVGDELRGISIIKEIDGIQGALLQVFTETQNEEICFKLYQPNTKLIQSFSTTINSEPGSTQGSYADNKFFTIHLSDANSTPVLGTNLTNAYPNPFNPSTTISFSIGKNAGQLNLEIFNIRGQKVRTLIASQLEQGQYKVVWDGLDDNDRNASSGVYFCRLKTNNLQKSIKLIMVK